MAERGLCVSHTTIHRAVDKHGKTVDFLLRPDRSTAAITLSGIELARLVSLLSLGTRQCR
jgi:hypothetical protein